MGVDECVWGRGLLGECQVGWAGGGVYLGSVMGVGLGDVVHCRENQIIVNISGW